ncbi:hypothetical protein M8998_01035 [Sphingobacterium sp. lm-10]|uniref:hypothetical protein n=1 Tax=Sphingobacterium sp. lm-10 TaxID=2944904 RepID=UPI002021862F|nr:hypothetical protein [Sphingobacterium sp. lm-10]MCL7986514.1 hypothetical protein [Sphingobacterium sp. lm-10]
MKTSYNYESASVAIEMLKQAGYEVDYNIEFDELHTSANDYKIDHIYRYEGATDPGDESHVYGIQNVKTGSKGVFVAGDISVIEGKKRDIILELEVRARHEEQKGS